MPRKRVSITERELAILEALWELGSSTIRQMVESLYGEHTPSLHATVKSLLDRLIEKSWVACESSGFVHCFFARHSRQDYVAG